MSRYFTDGEGTVLDRDGGSTLPEVVVECDDAALAERIAAALELQDDIDVVEAWCLKTHGDASYRAEARSGHGRRWYIGYKTSLMRGDRVRPAYDNYGGDNTQAESIHKAAEFVRSTQEGQAP